jgi:hypothetical protein
MSFVEDHFRTLKERYPAAVLEDIRNGTFLVTIPRMALPPGWNRPATTAYFIVPVGYPQARPDSFWTEPGLALVNGGPPQNATPGGNVLQGLPPGLLWFSWHPNGWSPNRDTLVTYARLIESRFRTAR